MIRTVRIQRILFAALLLSVTIAAAQDFALREGDRVVFYGDSITDQRLYTTFTETYVVTRFPKKNITFVHSGWGGDRVSGGGGGPVDVRLWRDVLAYNPTVVTIMLGMNDGRYRPFDQKIFDDYSSGYKHIIEVLKRQAPRARITAIQPSPFDDVTRPPTMELGYNAVLVRYGEFVKEIAASEKLSVADLNTSVVAALAKAKATDAEASAKIVPDRVHPGPSGHLLMAEALLKSWNAPAIVTDVELDSSRKEPLRQVNTRVSDISTSKGLSWTQSDEALPMPVDMSDAVMALAVNSSDFTEALNRQPLKVRGLAAGKYTLKIDGETVGAFTSDQLAASINLATLPTPMAAQAAEVHALTLRHNNLHAARWRQIQVPMEKVPSGHTMKVLQAIDDLEQEVIENQKSAAQPKARKFELTPER